MFTSNLGAISLLDTEDSFGTMLTADAPSGDGAISIDLLVDQTVIATAGMPGSVTETNTVSVMSTGVLTIEEAFGFQVNLTGSSVVLGEITTEQFDPGGDADSTGGDLMVMADTTITDDDDALINGAGDLFIAGASTLTAPDGITLDEATHDFMGAVTATAAGTAGSVTLVDATDLRATVLAGTAGSITETNTVSVTAGGALSIVEALGFDIDLTGNNVSLGIITTEEIDPGEADPFGGDLTVTAENGSIDDNIDGIFTIDGDAEFTADTDGEAITIDDPGHLFGGTVTATGHDLIFDFEASTPIIGTLIASGFLTLEAEGTLTGDPADFLDIDETAMLTSNEGAITFESASNSFGGDVTAVADDVITLSGGSTDLTVDATAGDDDMRANVDLDTLGILTVTSFGAATTLDAQSIVVSSIDAASLAAAATNNISGGSTVVTGISQLSSTLGSIELTGGNNFQGQVLATALGVAGAITLDDTATLDLVAVAGTNDALTTDNSVNATATETLTAVIFANAINANGASVVLADIDALATDGGEGGTLNVDALTGTVTDTGQVIANGIADLEALGDIILDNGTNDFDVLVTATSDDGGITIVDTDELTVDLSADDAVLAQAGGVLTTTAASGSSVDLTGTEVALFDINSGGMLTADATTGGITDGNGSVAGSAIDVTGDTHLTANGAITLDNLNNDFVGLVNADGTAITLFDAEDLSLANIDAGEDLTVTVVSGIITDGASGFFSEDINVTGDAFFTVNNAVDGSVITIDDATNSFGGTVTADGFDVVLGFSGGQELGTIDAAGDFNVETGGNLTGGTVMVTGQTQILSAGSVTLTDAANDFQDQVTADFAEPDDPGTQQNISLFDSNGLALTVGSVDDAFDDEGNVVVGANRSVNATSDGDMTFTSFGPAVTIESDGSITIVQAVASTFDATAANDITGQLVIATDEATLTSETGSISLENNAFFAAVTARAEQGDIRIEQANDLEIDAIGMNLDLESSEDLTVLAEGSNVSLTGENVLIDAVTATESLTVLADDNITGLVEAAVLSTTASGGNVEVINSPGGVETTLLTAGGDIDLSSVNNLFGDTLTVTGQNIVMGSADETLDASLISNDTGDITFVSSGNIQLVAQTAAGNIDLDNTGDLGLDVDAVGGAVVVDNVGALTGSIDASGNVDVDNMGDTDLDILSTTGSIMVVNTGLLQLDADATSGAVTVNNDGALTGSITANADVDVDTMDDTDLDVQSTMGNIDVNSIGELLLSAIASAGNVVVTNIGNAIIDLTGTGGSVDVTNTGELQIDINPGEEEPMVNNVVVTNNEGSLVASIQADGDVDLSNSGDVLLTQLDADGNLLVDSGGEITQGAETFNVGGTTDLEATGSITLANTANNFAGEVSASGTEIHLTDANSLVLGDINASEDFVVVFAAEDTTGADGGSSLTDNGGRVITVAGSTDISTGLETEATILSASGGPSVNLDNALHRFAGGLSLRRIGGSATLTETAEAFETDFLLRNLEVGGDLTISTGRNIILVGPRTADENGVFDLATPLEQRNLSQMLANQTVMGQDDASLHAFIADGATWLFDTTAGGMTAGANLRIDRPVDTVGSEDLSAFNVNESQFAVDQRQALATELGELSLSAGTEGEVRFRDFVGSVRPLGFVRVLTAGSAYIGSTLPTSPDNPEDDAFIMATRRNPSSNADLNLRDFFFASALTFDDVTTNGQVLVPEVHADNGFEYFGINVSGAGGAFEGGALDGLGISGFAFGGTPNVIEIFGGIAPDGGDLVRGRSGGLLADGTSISTSTTFNGCQIGDTSSCINLELPVVLIAPQSTVTVDTISFEETNESNFLAFGNEQLWANPSTFFILAPLPELTEE
ncbi:MAG: hypothetical protein AAFX52_15135 [Pseudomonadota bacterium]